MTIATVIEIAVILACQLYAEFRIEPRFSIRRKLADRLGVIPACLLVILLLAGIDTAAEAIVPAFSHTPHFRIAMLGLMLYLLPFHLIQQNYAGRKNGGS